MAKSIASAEEALEILERLRALSELSELTPATLETAVEDLAGFLGQIPSREDELKKLSEAFEEGSEALSRELIDSAYHPQSTGTFNPYDNELRKIADDREKMAQGWIPADELRSDDFEVPEGMEIEWDNGISIYSGWGRLVEAKRRELDGGSRRGELDYFGQAVSSRYRPVRGGRLG